ncbi:hypothetical protein [Paenibacillus paeoniae]|uniref:DUF4359 domain-containing protein n=1 Tax=Paenibacillus paeoniae TaxID=2292705 RepID=A0A371PF20_9BACL|nr:hypothetical protein [Paenibacillus paeoniae]REK74544.1 hypothetical protein DX130_12640 [Paenibacillus paeoniae]
MKKRWLPILLIVFVILAFTVPTTEDYNEALKNKIKKETGNHILVNVGVSLLGDVMNTLIDTSTSCQKYVVIRACETKITNSDRFKSIGLLNYYIFY